MGIDIWSTILKLWSAENKTPFEDAVRQYQLSYPLLLGFVFSTLEFGPRSGLAQDFVGVFM